MTCAQGKKTIRRVKKKKDEKKGADEEEDRHPLVEREDANSLFGTKHIDFSILRVTPPHVCRFVCMSMFHTCMCIIRVVLRVMCVWFYLSCVCRFHV